MIVAYFIFFLIIRINSILIKFCFFNNKQKEELIWIDCFFVTSLSFTILQNKTKTKKQKKKINKTAKTIISLSSACNNNHNNNNNF